VSYGNANGSAKPPTILFQVQIMKREWLDALSPGSIAQMTSRGSMITEAFVHWLAHFSHYLLTYSMEQSPS
jgi:hypothetical protein